MKFKADCFFFGRYISFQLYGSSVSCFLVGFVAFILTGYLLSARVIRNWKCPELRFLVNFLLD